MQYQETNAGYKNVKKKKKSKKNKNKNIKKKIFEKKKN